MTAARGDPHERVPGAPGEPEILVGATPEVAARIAAERLAAAIEAGLARRGRADVATTGGSTSPALYRALLAPPVRGRIAWSRLHIWFGDDRFVPRRDPDSNLVAVDSVLLAGDAEVGLEPAPLPPGNLHPVPVDATLAAGEGPAEAAAAYEAALRVAVPADAAGRPVFDAILVGIGPDGHLLSVFPGSAAFDARGWVVPIPAPTHVAPHLARVSLTPGALDATPALIPMAFGASKAAILASVLAGPEGRAPPSRPASAPRRGDMDPRRGGCGDAAARLTARGYDPCSDRVPAGRDATGIPVRHGEAQVFSRVTIGFGAALVGVSVIAAVSGATAAGTASVPAVIGGLFILFGWLDRRISPPKAGRFQSRSRFPIIGAAVLVLSSARGITLVTDAHDPASTPGGTEAFPDRDRRSPESPTSSSEPGQMWRRYAGSGEPAPPPRLTRRASMPRALAPRVPTLRVPALLTRAPRARARPAPRPAPGVALAAEPSGSGRRAWSHIRALTR